jgi:ABC-type multidrug transport system fused ATPase/permease subunit
MGGISKHKQDELHRKIAYIPQDTILFHWSIYENISYGNLKASTDEELYLLINLFILMNL